eukprot:Sdes_comp21227_c0_seq1m19883
METLNSESVRVTILCDFIETLVHMILYIRNIYPSFLFQKTRKYSSLLVPWCRCEPLCRYIHKVIQTGVAQLLEVNLLESFYVVITQKQLISEEEPTSSALFCQQSSLEKGKGRQNETVHTESVVKKKKIPIERFRFDIQCGEDANQAFQDEKTLSIASQAFRECLLKLSQCSSLLDTKMPEHSIEDAEVFESNYSFHILVRTKNFNDAATDCQDENPINPAGHLRFETDVIPSSVTSYAYFDENSWISVPDSDWDSSSHVLIPLSSFQSDWLQIESIIEEKTASFCS